MSIAGSACGRLLAATTSLALLAALCCLVVGLVQLSSPWLTASLVATVTAGALVLVLRVTSRARAAGPASAEVWVAEGRARFHRAGCDQLRGQQTTVTRYEQALADGMLACSLCEPDEVSPPGAARS